jgi:hypothetical protein
LFGARDPHSRLRYELPGVTEGLLPLETPPSDGRWLDSHRPACAETVQVGTQRLSTNASWSISVQVKVQSA